MRSSFFGFNVATQGLYTSRTNLDVANHNISHAESKGYSRQYSVQKATRPMRSPGSGMVGTGVRVNDIGQYRDAYVDNKYWSFNKDLGQYKIKDELLKQMELSFNEPDETGITRYLDDLFISFEILSTKPTEYAAKQGVVQALNSFVKAINDVSAQLRQQQDDANFGVLNSVNKINFISQQVTLLNQQIDNLEMSGYRANDLRDQRMLLVDELSEIVPVTTKVITNAHGAKTFCVLLNGQSLVNGYTNTELKAVPREEPNNPEDNADLYDVYWQSGRKLYLNSPNFSGKLKGYIDIRDGNNKKNFTGTIKSGSGTDTIVMQPVNRNDIAEKGTLYIEGAYIKYKSFTYDEANKSIEFKLDQPAPVGAQSASMGTSLDFKGIPYYLGKLNEFTRTMARKFNELHEAGDSGEGQSILVYKNYKEPSPLDTSKKSTYNIIDSDNIMVNENLLADANLLMTKRDKDSGESDNDLLQDFIALRNDTKVFETGRPDDFLQSIIGEMGVDAKQIGSFNKSQRKLLDLAINQRLSISGVDLNEEIDSLMANLRVYNYAARTIRVFDEIYDVTINQMAAR